MSGMNQKVVKSFCTAGERGTYVCPTEKQVMHVENEYHGTYDLDWIVVVENLVEIKRYNMMDVGSVEWLT